MSVAERFSPGELVRARGREWVVLDSGEALTVRPLSGSESEIETIIPELEAEPVEHASFADPAAEKVGGRDGAQLLRDALRLSLRRGAGPFRAAGRINFEPRAYQLAPLMMALRQDTVRLLIADDVGIGKTVEAGIIVREMLDRGEIDRFTVLCPPHLVDQWALELETKFAIPATPVTASAAARLERDLPNSTSIFEAYPYTVVSLDFIKSEKRFFDFKRACPDMVVVDEAHASVSAGRGRQRRFELVRALADDPDRHMIFLTATPHSGDENAFHSLLGLLDRDFLRLQEVSGEAQRSLRERLARHFIQRRRADIEAWREPGLFPIHQTDNDRKYRLTGEYEAFYGAVLDYCAEVIQSVEGEAKQRLAFWGTLALMRCVGSSPAAALRALRTRAHLDPTAISESELSAATLDDEELSENDLEPGMGPEEGSIGALIDTAERLSRDISNDPKFKVLATTVKQLLAESFAPVVFCRYIATAEAVGAAFSSIFKDHQVEVVTGGLPSEEREIRVESLGQNEKRILVATDCLSEGINLQGWFDAVVHYDLSWNPTRHQQREGRIDRFGQKSKVVRSVLIYGENNPVDGAVLDVILRKARAIEKQTGVRVPMPDEGGSLTKALMSAVLLRAREKKQLALDLDFTSSEQAREIEIAWLNASENEKRSRTIFAQNSLKPDEVAAEWEATQRALGGYEDTERFVSTAMKRLGAPLQPLSKGGFKAPVHLTPEAIRERYAAESMSELGDDAGLKIDFKARPATGCVAVHRAHAMPTVLAEVFLEQALDTYADQTNLATLPRVGVWESEAADAVTYLLLLRIRHRLDSRGKLGPQFQMAEEAAAIAVSATGLHIIKKDDAAFALFDAEAGNVPEHAKATEVARALECLPSLRAILTSYANERSEALAEDHTRVRQSLGSKAQVRVQAITPVDVIGLYVLLPAL
ncbi:DEAD/DEAH box helicase [Cereibacter sphaeroides]|uniref:DEAD/DEAH box helicase n=1 Tax=Cereibacter sphaeroides TaxID=1063 RepID=UPI001F3FA22F|nr:DEAD/DEAH box helicase [Cereibacter sphaeroides]MCE6967195.1 DEAD/DEAH box helicase [Cereibacter sphaeroides]